MSEDEPRFICDDHCGRLARWLRFLGFDCAYERDISDNLLLRHAIREQRIILTRDHSLATRAMARSVIQLDSSDPLAQVRQVLDGLHLAADRGRIGTQCTICNRPTIAVRRETVALLVPPYVRKTQQHFRRCRECGRIYWKATHVNGMLERLQTAGVSVKNQAGTDPKRNE